MENNYKERKKKEKQFKKLVLEWLKWASEKQKKIFEKNPETKAMYEKIKDIIKKQELINFLTNI